MARWRALFRSRWDREPESPNHFLLARDLSLMQAAEYDVVNADIDEIVRMLPALSGKPGGPRGAQAFRARS